MPQPSLSPAVFLETPRLRLRQFVMEDLDHIVALDSDPEVMRYISYGAPTPREAIATRVLPAWLKYFESDERIGFWAAELRASNSPVTNEFAGEFAGEFVGWFHLRPDRFTAGEQELGYRLRRDMWGKGLATEGSLALLVDGFEVSQFAKITARALLGNVASQRVMQKCGLKFEADFVYSEQILRGGTEEQRRAVKYSISRDEWMATRISDAK